MDRKYITFTMIIMVICSSFLYAGNTSEASSYADAGIASSFLSTFYWAYSQETNADSLSINLDFSRFETYVFLSYRVILADAFYLGLELGIGAGRDSSQLEGSSTNYVTIPGRFFIQLGKGSNFIRLLSGSDTRIDTERLFSSSALSEEPAYIGARIVIGGVFIEGLYPLSISSIGTPAVDSNTIPLKLALGLMWTNI